MYLSYLTSMDWTPSDSSSTQLLLSSGPRVMAGASAGVAASSSSTAAEGSAPRKNKCINTVYCLLFDNPHRDVTSGLYCPTVLSQWS